MNVPIRCIHCGRQDFVKKGMRTTKLRGKIQKYYCLACDHYFTNDDGFYRMRNNPAKITKAIDLYFSNLSSRKVHNQYKRHEDTKISHESILAWCRKYALKVHKYAEKLKPSLGGSAYADDTEIDCRGEKHHFWACVDWETRYISATHYSIRSGENEAVHFLNKTKKCLPKYIQTDAAMFYPAAFNRAFYVNKLQGLSVKHRVNNHQKTRRHNVRIETVFMKIKDRVDDFRGLKATWSAPILLAGVTLQHNFIEAHTTTGRIPAELAGLPKETEGNRWLEMIQLACI